MRTACRSPARVDRFQQRSRPRVRVRADMTDALSAVGFVWREANPADHRLRERGRSATETRQENDLADQRGWRDRRSVRSRYLPARLRVARSYSRATMSACRSASAHPARAEQRRSRVSARNPARMVFGPNTCKPGLRVARGGRHRLGLCRRRPCGRAAHAGKPARPCRGVRRLAARSARIPASRALCGAKPFPSDHVCVPVASRTEARNDNGQASNRLAIP